MIISRPRRNRKNQAIRSLIQENNVTVNDLVMPLFITEGQRVKERIDAIDGIYRYSQDTVLYEIEELIKLDIKAIAPFPVVADKKKDKTASEARKKNGHYIKTIEKIKTTFPDIQIFSDVAMDPYSSDGHDGLVDEAGEILNDQSLEILADIALCQAQAGSDVVCPSDMMDGRVHYIRNKLDKAHFQSVSILSYSVKYASNFYNPFRLALDSTPQSGDKKTYQMDPANSIEAKREVLLDVEEGADFVMVKPAMMYLDVIQSIKQIVNIPVVAYNVSGEYAMLQSAAKNNLLNFNLCLMEVLFAIKRAGASFIFTYHAKQVAEILS